MRVYRSGLEAAQGTGSAAAIYRLDQPTRLSPAWSRPGTARFRFARQDNCSSTPSIGLDFRMARHPPRNQTTARI